MNDVIIYVAIYAILGALIFAVLLSKFPPSRTDLSNRQRLAEVFSGLRKESSGFVRGLLKFAVFLIAVQVVVWVWSNLAMDKSLTEVFYWLIQVPWLQAFLILLAAISLFVFLCIEIVSLLRLVVVSIFNFWINKL